MPCVRPRSGAALTTVPLLFAYRRCSVTPEVLTRLSSLPHRRCQCLSLARITRLVQGLNSPAVGLLVSVVITLGHSHRLVAGEVVDLLDRDSNCWRSLDKSIENILHHTLHARVYAFWPSCHVMLMCGKNVTWGSRQTLRPPNGPGVEHHVALGTVVDRCGMGPLGFSF